MKNLANCTPSEFIKQTVRLKDVVPKWLQATEIMKIRATKPKLIAVPENATKDEQEEITKENSDIIRKQAIENLNMMIDKMFAEHPQETLEVLALSCFVEPDDVDNYTMDEYFCCLEEMAQAKSVVNFFSLLAQREMHQKST
jgi:hypothetical protein